MHLTHKIRLSPSAEQAEYFKRACGTARFVWNWALAEWNRQYAAGLKPNAMALKKQFNAIKYREFPWIKDIHRDAHAPVRGHAQPFAHLDKAFKRSFQSRKEGKDVGLPRFKKKGRCRESFYVANDKFRIENKRIRLPKVGWVEMAEALRFEGKILGATVSRTADRWYVAIQVEVKDKDFYRRRTGHGIVGIDLGVKALATLSTGEVIEAPRPLKRAMRRIQIRSRRLSRKLTTAKVQAGLEPNQPIPKGTKLPVSRNREKSARRLARTHARVANLRADVLHKLTTRLCCENQAVALEDLNVQGMMSNRKLARAIADVGLSAFRRMITYKAQRYGTRVILADRWYASTRLCSVCGWKNDALTLRDRAWACPQCGTAHERDVNAAINLQRLATVPALPEASSTSDGGAAVEGVSIVVGKVTPVRDDSSTESGQEEHRDHL